MLRYPRRVGTLLIVSFTGEGKFVTLPQKGWDTPHSELYRGGEICYVTPEGLGHSYSELYRGGEICYVTPEGLGHSS